MGEPRGGALRAADCVHPATVAVAATNDGAHDGASAVQYTYFDPNAPSVATAVAPAYTQYDGDGADVAIYGRNFAPTGELFRVRYGGRAVAATFVSSSEVRARFGSSPEDATSKALARGHSLRPRRSDCGRRVFGRRRRCRGRPLYLV